MAGTNKIQKVRIYDIEIEMENIFRECEVNDTIEAMLKPMVELLIFRLKERANGKDK